MGDGGGDGEHSVRLGGNIALLINGDNANIFLLKNKSAKTKRQLYLKL